MKITSLVGLKKRLSDAVVDKRKLSFDKSPNGCSDSQHGLAIKAAEEKKDGFAKSLPSSLSTTATATDKSNKQLHTTERLHHTLPM